MQSEFYIYVSGEQQGPFPILEIEKKLKSGEMAPTDYIYVEEKSDWITVLDFDPLKNVVQTTLPKVQKLGPVANKDPRSEAGLNESEWYVLKGDNRYGPFVFTDLIRMLQEKSLFEYEFVWRPGMAAWQRVAEVDEFKPNRVRALVNSENKGVSELFFRRRHRRAKFNGSIIVHNNQQVWKGQSIEISAGGAGLIIENAMIVPGQKLFLHFKPGEGVPPFNAVCEVVSKRFLKEIKHKEQAIFYGVKFVSIGESAQNMIAEYTAREKSVA